MHEYSMIEALEAVLAEFNRPRLVTKVPGGYNINNGDGWPYEVSECDRPDQALSWLVHLRDKSWFTDKHEDDFLSALIAAGVFSHA